MKLITTTALALIAAFGAAPAAAQDKPAPPAQKAEQKVTPSKGAMKAIVELQEVVQKNDFASVPAKVAAAQAVATTAGDHYAIAKLRLDAAVASNPAIFADAAGLPSMLIEREPSSTKSRCGVTSSRNNLMLSRSDRA